MCYPGCIDVDGSVSRVALEPGATPQPLASLGPGVGEAIAVDARGDPFPAVTIKKHRAMGPPPRCSRPPGPKSFRLRGKRIVHTRAKKLRAKVAGVAHPASPRRQTRAPAMGAARVDCAARLTRANKDMPQFWQRERTTRHGKTVSPQVVRPTGLRVKLRFRHPGSLLLLREKQERPLPSRLEHGDVELGSFQDPAWINP